MFLVHFLMVTKIEFVVFNYIFFAVYIFCNALQSFCLMARIQDAALITVEHLTAFQASIFYA